jgi:hypothetical protein
MHEKGNNDDLFLRKKALFIDFLNDLGQSAVATWDAYATRVFHGISPCGSICPRRSLSAAATRRT